MNGMRACGTVAAALLPCAMALVGCGTGGRTTGRAAPPDTAKWAGIYESDTLPGAARPRVLLVKIGPDTVASAALAFVGLGTTLHPGWWSAKGDVLRVQPIRPDGTANELAFVWRREGTRLVPVQWDRGIYGEQGATLTRRVPAAQVPADTAAGARR